MESHHRHQGCSEKIKSIIHKYLISSFYCQEIYLIFSTTITKLHTNENFIEMDYAYNQEIKNIKSKLKKTNYHILFNTEINY